MMSLNVLADSIEGAGVLAHSVISAVPLEGLHVETADGKPATLAVVDEQGNIVESGDAVLEEAFNVVVLSYARWLEGRGRLRIISAPHGILLEPRGQDVHVDTKELP